MAALMTDILTSDLVTHPKENALDLYERYRQIHKTLLAHIKYKYVSQKLPAPWMTPGMIQSRRRRLEHVWRNSRSSLDRSRHSRQCHLCFREMAKAKSNYYENIASNNSATSQQLWKCINQISQRRPVSFLNMHQSSHCMTFCSLFKNNITLIHFAIIGLTPDFVNTDFPEVNF